MNRGARVGESRDALGCGAGGPAPWVGAMEGLAHRTSSGGSMGWHGFMLLSLLPLAECSAPSGYHLIWVPLTESQVQGTVHAKIWGLDGLGAVREWGGTAGSSKKWSWDPFGRYVDTRLGLELRGHGKPSKILTCECVCVSGAWGSD